MMNSADVARELGVSTRHAVALMPSMGAIDVSLPGSRRPLWRVAEEDFREWRKERGAEAKMGSGDAVRSGGAGSGASALRLGARIVKRRVSRERGSKERPQIQLPRSHGKLP